MHYLINIDTQLLKWAYRRSFTESFSVKALIFMGDGPFWLIIVFVSALAGQFLEIESLHQLTLQIMTGMIISNVIFVLLKTKIKRRRPYANPELQQFLQLTIRNRDPGHASREMESFPSGHVLWTSLCVVLIVHQFGFVALLLFGWLVPAMLYLRPHLGVHYPSDVLAGLTLGVVNAAVTLCIDTNLLKYLDAYRDHSGYLYAYWVLICIFLFLGFKSWLKRV